ncbi:MAG: DUF5615 family PIN-like protein [Fimbriimonadaceae bacterium]|nr:DUF5615 family PIN-like protein [Fimbriimonadaceae bacterium]
MTLFFDENLSFKLPSLVHTHFPGSESVVQAGLAGATDDEVWSYAASRGHAIVTKDADIAHLSVHRVEEVTVVWIRLGNCSTDEIAGRLRAVSQELRAVPSGSLYLLR